MNRQCETIDEELIIGHAVDTLASDQSFINEHAETLDSLADQANLTGFSTQIRFAIDTNHASYTFLPTRPRISLVLIAGLYGGLKSLSENPNPEQQIREYSAASTAYSDYLVAMTGLTTEADPVAELQISKGNMDHCAAAEAYFIDARDQLNTKINKKNRYLSAYQDISGKPIIFRKSHAASTGITLEPLSVNGFNIPQGTIISVGMQPDRMSLPTGRVERNRDILYAYGMRSLAISPLRLSAWAFDDPLDRTMFAVSGSKSQIRVDKAKAEILANNDLGSLRQAARNILEMCTDAEQPVNVNTY